MKVSQQKFPDSWYCIRLYTPTNRCCHWTSYNWMGVWWLCKYVMMIPNVGREESIEHTINLQEYDTLCNVDFFFFFFCHAVKSRDIFCEDSSWTLIFYHNLQQLLYISLMFTCTQGHTHNSLFHMLSLVSVWIPSVWLSKNILHLLSLFDAVEWDIFLRVQLCNFCSQLVDKSWKLNLWNKLTLCTWVQWNDCTHLWKSNYKMLKDRLSVKVGLLKFCTMQYFRWLYVEPESSVLLVDESYILSLALRAYEQPGNEEPIQLLFPLSGLSVASKPRTWCKGNINS